jgi:aminoglycoside phosphotransferase family enzyme
MQIVIFNPENGYQKIKIEEMTELVIKMMDYRRKQVLDMIYWKHKL